MSITKTANGGFVATGKAVDYVRLASIKGMVKLESVGMKGRAGPIRPRIAAEFGLSARASYQNFINAIQTKMDELAPLVQKEEA